MNKSLMKRVPTVVVAVLGLACSLPYLTADESQVAAAAAAATESEAGEKASAKEKPSGKDKPEVKAPKPSLKKLLRPKLLGRPLRDPFKDPAVQEAETKTLVVNAFKEFVAKKVLKTADGRFPTTAKNFKAKADKTAASEKAKSAFDPLSALSLDATYVLEDRGAAMINGELYRPGDALRDLKVNEPCVVREVNSDSVLVDYRGQTYSLVYRSAVGKVKVASRKVNKPRMTPSSTPIGGPKRR